MINEKSGGSVKLDELIGKQFETLEKNALHPTIDPVRFNFPISEDSFTEVVKRCYRLEVEKSGKVYIPDSYTDTHIGKLCHWLCSTSHRQSLMISGGIGNGKTTLLKSAISAIEIFGKSLYEIGYSDNSYGLTDAKLIRKYDRFSEDYKDKLLYFYVRALDVSKNDSEVLRECYNTNLLFIDDLGTEPSSVKDYGTPRTPMVELLYKRYDWKLPVIFTTNYTLSDIEKVYNARVSDRLKDMCDLLVFENGSYRGR